MAGAASSCATSSTCDVSALLRVFFSDAADLAVFLLFAGGMMDKYGMVVWWYSLAVVMSRPPRMRIDRGLDCQSKR